ncbi:MAG TPA: polyprenyl synthetase family protein [Pyrinomonadaceae bacterium]|nr:polyprenyl synthetase family protein [Pyrinomonadaceae bacterium]
MPKCFCRHAPQVSNSGSFFQSRLQLDEVEKQMGAGTMRAFVHLPLLIYEGVKGEFQNAIPLSAACSLIFLGLDIFDDVADGDFREHWRGHKPSEMNLIAATLLCSVPKMIIAELDAPPATIAAMQKTLAAGLLEMSAGQQADLTGANRENISVEAVEKSVAGKGGAEVEMFARMAAQFAGASREQTDAYGKFAKNLGIAGQLASDCFEMFCDSDARDLKNGTRTLPLALHLERLTDEPRGEFLSLLNAARNEETARQAVRELLQKAGVLRRAAFIIEIYCQKARNSLDAAKPTDFARENLRTIIDSNSFFTNKKQEKL